MVEDRPAETIQSLARALGIFRAFDAEHPALTLSAVAARSRLSRAAARRALHTLVELGYAEQRGSVFRLRPRLLDLGFEHFADLTLEEVLLPHLQQLAETVHETVSAAVLDGDHIVYIARVAARRVVRVQVRTGARFPAEATAMGRALLAQRSEEWLDGFLASMTPERREGAERLREQLAVVRERGYAVVDQELEQGLHTIAVAVRDRDGRAVAAVDVATAAGPGREAPASHVPALRTAAAAIEADLRPLANLEG